MKLGPRALRWFLNFYPPYFFTRTKVKSLSPDWRTCVVELKKSFLTRNYVGTTFGGSLFAATDPFYMLMLIGILGIESHIVWDKAARIEYLKPVRSKVTFRFQIGDEDLEKIAADLGARGKSEPEFTVEGVDQKGEVCVRVLKTLYVRKK